MNTNKCSGGGQNRFHSNADFITAGRQFVIEHKGLIILCIIELLFIYGIKIFNYNIGADTDIFLSGSNYLNWKSIGRFGLVLLKMLSPLGKFNLYAANFCAALLLLVGAIFWCILFDMYSEKKSKWAYMAFCLFYLSSAVWVESNYFSCMSVETSFNVMLCPVCIWLMWEGITTGRKLRIVCSVFLLIGMISIYQAIIVMFCDGVLIVWLLHLEKDNWDKKQNNRIFLNIVFAGIISLVGYVIANWVFTHIIFQVESSNYLTSQIGGSGSFKGAVLQFMIFVYNLLFGDAKLLNHLIDPIVQEHAQSGAEAVVAFHGYQYLSCILYLPAIACFGILLCRNKKKSIFYYLSSFGVLLCAIIFVIAGGGSAPVRALYALALTSGFLFYYIVTHLRSKRTMVVWMVLIVLFGGVQLQKSSMLVASDQVRYEKDLWLCNKINDAVMDLKAEKQLSDPQVFIVGSYAFEYGENYSKGELLGQSCINFGSSNTKREATHRGLAFMKAHGYAYKEVEEDSGMIDELRREAVRMPSFPNAGWVKVYQGVIIVKLSDLVHLE